MSASPLRIRLFNVKYSPNLGDGLLSEALENVLREMGCDAQKTYSVDLAGRTNFGPGNSSRATLLRLLSALPPRLRRTALRLPMAIVMRRHWRPHYERHLEDADAVVVGGGNLFTDIDLNFPLKIAQALTLAADRKLPVAIQGVGVSASWSEPGLFIMRKALAIADIRHVSVRDEPSRERFDRLFADAAGIPAGLARDPGLLVSRYVRPGGQNNRGAVGLSVTSAIAVRYHSPFEVGDDALADWYVELCRTLAANGHRIVSFTNGSPEDEIFLDSIHDRLAGACEGAYERRKVTTPTELAQLISGLGSLVAHRMHALIAGYSYGVPIFALRWDSKVDAFMSSIGALDQMAAAEAGTQSQIVDFVSRQNASGHSAASELKERVLIEAFDQSSLLLQAFRR